MTATDTQLHFIGEQIGVLAAAINGMVYPLAFVAIAIALNALWRQ